MSSATSIEPAAAPAARPEPAARDSFKPWHFFVLASLLAATAAVVLARQSRPEHLVLISLTIGAAGFAAAVLYRTLVPLVSAEAAASVAPLRESVRSVLEREKQLTLRSLKELEFDRAMGKVAQKDFDEMAGRLRARAISLMKQLDAEGAYREMIERELSVRLRHTATKAHGSTAAPQKAHEPVRPSCPCGTPNDADATFCKHCGSRLAAAKPS